MRVKIISILLLSTSCRTIAPSTSSAPQMERKCDAPEIVIPEGLGLSEVDLEHTGYAQKGCEKYFGPGACLVKLIRLEGERNYHAICRRSLVTNSVSDGGNNE